MSQLTLNEARNNGSSTVVNPQIAGTTTNRTNNLKFGKVQPNGQSLDVTVSLVGYTPLPGSE